MPRIADRIALLNFKPGTRDKRKRQTRFDHDPDVLTREKIHAAVKALMNSSVHPVHDEDYFVINPELEDLAKQLSVNAAQSVNDIIKQAMTEATWADQADQTDFPTTIF